MPKQPQNSQPHKLPKLRWVKFWIRSNRGTDCTTYTKLRHGISDDGIKEKLEQWCSGFAAWSISDVSYGYARVRQPPAAWLKKNKTTLEKLNHYYSEKQRLDAEKYEMARQAYGLDQK